MIIANVHPFAILEADSRLYRGNSHTGPLSGEDMEALLQAPLPRAFDMACA